MEEKKNEDNEKDKTRERIIKIIIIIIIILLLLHNCCLFGKKNKDKPTEAVIDLCDGKDCNDTIIDCTIDFNNEYCIVPDFTGKTKQNVNEWLSKIKNKINIKFVYEYSKEQDGIIFEQSENGISVKDLIDNNKTLIIKITDNKNSKIDCLKDEHNEMCIVPDFTGKTKEDVEEWLNLINNQVYVKYEVKDSNEKSGTVIEQSDKGRTIKELVDEDKDLDITFSNSRIERINCLEDIYNELCVIPDFTGKTKKDVLDWLDHITNELKSEFKEEKSDKHKGIVTNQSDKGRTIKELIDDNKELVITFSNNDKVNCLIDDSNPICVIPNFTGGTKKDVQNWLDSVENLIPAEYQGKQSDNTTGTILAQSNKRGQTIKDLYETNTKLVLTLADEKQSPQTKDDKIEDNIIVKDSNVVWNKTTEINIFQTSKSKVENTIAPESSGIYEFVVKNGTNSRIEYNLSFIETNTQNINIKYKLRRNNTYIIDNYVSASELNLNSIIINKNSEDKYYLEWKWISSDNDTEIGEKSAIYKLKMEVEAESK